MNITFLLNHSDWCAQTSSRVLDRRSSAEECRAAVVLECSASLTAHHRALINSDRTGTHSIQITHLFRDRLAPELRWSCAIRRDQAAPHEIAVMQADQSNRGFPWRGDGTAALRQAVLDKRQSD